MASVQDLLKEALEAFGELTGPTPDLTSSFAVSLKRQLIRTYRVRIPTHVPGLLRDSYVDNLAFAGGEFLAWPSNVAAVRAPLRLVDKNASETQPCFETNPAQFWSWHVLNDTTEGTPDAVLVEGRQFRFRPIPAVALADWRVFYPCTVYPDAPANDTDDLIRLELEDAVLAGTVLWQSWREGWDDLAARFQPQWESALSHLEKTELTKTRAVYRPTGF